MTGGLVDGGQIEDIDLTLDSGEPDCLAHVAREVFDPRDRSLPV